MVATKMDLKIPFLFFDLKKERGVSKKKNIKKKEAFSALFFQLLTTVFAYANQNGVKNLD